MGMEGFQFLSEQSLIQYVANIQAHLSFHQIDMNTETKIKDYILQES